MPHGEYSFDDGRATIPAEQSSTLQQKSEQELTQLFGERVRELRAVLDQDAAQSADPERAARLRGYQETLLQNLENSLDPNEFEVPVYTDENGQEAFFKDYFRQHLDYIDDLQDALVAKANKAHEQPSEPTQASPNADLFPDGRVPMPDGPEYTPVADEFVRRQEASAKNAPSEMAQMLNRLDEQRRREREQMSRLEEYFSLPAPEPGASGIYELPSLPTVQTRDSTVSTVAEVSTPHRGDEVIGFNDETVVMPVVQPQPQKKSNLWLRVKSFFGRG